MPSIDPQSQPQVPVVETVMADDYVQFTWHLGSDRRQWKQYRLLLSALRHFCEDERRQ